MQTRNVYELPKQKPKLCKDCRFAKRSLFSLVFFGSRAWKYAKCTHKAAIQFKGDTLVYDVKDRDHMYCSTMRENFLYLDQCGPTGKYWEPK